MLKTGLNQGVLTLPQGGYRDDWRRYLPVQWAVRVLLISERQAEEAMRSESAEEIDG